MVMLPITCAPNSHEGNYELNKINKKTAKNGIAPAY